MEMRGSYCIEQHEQRDYQLKAAVAPVLACCETKSDCKLHLLDHVLMVQPYLHRHN